MVKSEKRKEKVFSYENNTNKVPKGHIFFFTLLFSLFIKGALHFATRPFGYSPVMGLTRTDQGPLIVPWGVRRSKMVTFTHRSQSNAGIFSAGLQVR